MVGSSTAPLVLLDGDLKVIAASASFFATFQINPAGAPGEHFFNLGEGEWNLPRLRSLLTATLSGAADVDAYALGSVLNKSWPFGRCSDSRIPEGVLGCGNSIGWMMKRGPGSSRTCLAVGVVRGGSTITG